MVGFVNSKMMFSENRLIVWTNWPIQNPKSREWEQTASANSSISRLNIEGERGHP